MTFETLITILTIENLDNLCYLTINCDTGQHSQFLRCFNTLSQVWKEIFGEIGNWLPFLPHQTILRAPGLNKYKKPFPCPFNFFEGTSETVALPESRLPTWRNKDIHWAHFSRVFKLGQLTLKKWIHQLWYVWATRGQILKHWSKSKPISTKYQNSLIENFSKRRKT